MGEVKEVFLVASGPSLKGFDYSRLAGKTVVTCNHAFRLVPGFLASFFYDWTFFAELPETEKEFVRAYASRFYVAPFAANNLKIKGLQTVTLSVNWRQRPGSVCNVNDSGAIALSWALREFPTATVRLFGYDQRADETGAIHATDDVFDHRYKTMTGKLEKEFQTRIGRFGIFSQDAHRVVNHSPFSAIPFFRKSERDDF